jgi:hypothetical protein
MESRRDDVDIGLPIPARMVSLALARGGSVPSEASSQESEKSVATGRTSESGGGVLTSLRAVVVVGKPNGRKAVGIVGRGFSEG